MNHLLFISECPCQRRSIGVIIRPNQSIDYFSFIEQEFPLDIEMLQRKPTAPRISLSYYHMAVTKFRKKPRNFFFRLLNARLDPGRILNLDHSDLVRIKMNIRRLSLLIRVVDLA